MEGEGLIPPPNYSVPTALQQQCGGLIISEMNFTTKIENTHDAEMFMNALKFPNLEISISFNRI